MIELEEFEPRGPVMKTRILTAIACLALCTAVKSADSLDDAKIRRAFDTFVNIAGEASEAQRLEAGMSFGGVIDQADAAKLMEIVSKQAESAKIRLLALEKLPTSGYSSTVPDNVLKQAQLLKSILDDPDESDEFKTAIVERLHLLANFTTGGAESRERLLSVMREQLTSEVETVRLTAMGYLATDGDDVAIGLLTDNLKNHVDSLYAYSDSIGFLSLDDPQSHFEVIRPYIDEELDEPTVAAAVRALEKDSRSRDKIRGYFQDDSASPGIRTVASEVLARSDAEFPSYALEVVSKEGNDLKVRAQVIKDLGEGIRRSVYSDSDQEKVIEVLENVSGESTELRNSLEQFKVHLRLKGDG